MTLRPARRLLAFFTVALGLPAAAQAPVEVGAAPAWVDAVDLELRAQATSASGGVEYLLLDHQENIALAEPEVYTHTAQRVVSPAGVQSESQVTLSFDPAYERLTVHTIRLRRGAEVLERLAAERFQVLQQETQLEQQLLDGRCTLLLVLDDVRVGDVIEVAYTLRGRNPAFGSKYAAAQALNSSVPVQRWRVRLLAPHERELAVRVHGGEDRSQLRELGELTERLWDQTDVPAVVYENYTPSWFDAFAWLQTSEFGSWDELAQWAEPLFRLPETTPPSVAEVARHVREQSADAREQLRLALRFVQDDVRYLGLELGASSFQPAPPDKVLERRYGDCKDKALLFCAILRELGIGASPALVNTLRRGHVAELLPSPLDFDHAIVRAELGDEELWVDPTSTHERGALSEKSLPDYGQALVVLGERAGLVDVERDQGEEPLTTIEKEFKVTLSGPVAYSVTTTFEGGDADGARRYVAAWSAEELSQHRTDQQTRSYRSVRALAPLAVRDDETRNRVVFEEHYAIDSFWGTPDASGTWGTFDQSEIGDELAVPDNRARRAPLALDFPRHLSVRTRVMLPEEWQIENQSSRLQVPGITITRGVRCVNRVLELSTDYRTFADHVPLAELARYRAQAQQLHASLGYQISKPVAGGGRAKELDTQAILAPLVGLLILAVVVGVPVGVLVWVARARRRGRAAVDDRRPWVPGDAQSAPFAAASALAAHAQPRVWRSESALVVELSSELPPRCVVCNHEASERIERKFRWHEPLLYLLILAGVLVYAIVATVVSKRAAVKLGLCARHHAARRRNLALAWSAGIAGFACVITAVSVESIVLGFYVGLPLLVFAAIFGQRKASIVRVTRIDEHCVHLSGTGKPFLESFERRAA